MFADCVLMNWDVLPALSIPSAIRLPYLLGAAIDPENASLVLAAVLLSLVIIYLSSKLGGEFCAKINLPPVLGELVGGGRGGGVGAALAGVSRRRR